MIKTFDCVDLKNELQRKLYEELKPENIDDYCRKLKEKRRKNKLYKALNNRIGKSNRV